MSFIFGFLTAWIIISAILFIAEEFDAFGITLICKDSTLICLTFPVAAPIIVVCLIIRFIKVMFYAIKSKIRTAGSVKNT